MKNRKLLFAILPTMFIAMFFITGCLNVSAIDNNPTDGVSSNDEFEPDNSPTHATEINVNDPQIHHIYNENGDYDIDYVKFNAVSGNTYRINLSEIKGFEPEVTLYDTDGSEVIEMKNTGTYTGTHDWWGYNKDHIFLEDEKESIVFTAGSNGTYYLSVKDLYGSNNAGSYTIKIFQK